MVRASLSTWLRQRGVDASFRALAELYPGAVVFSVDGQRNILSWNRAAEQVLGFSAEEAIGSHCLRSVRCERCISGCGIERFRAVADVSVVLHRADGQPVSFRKFGQGFVDDDGRFAGGIEVLIPEGQPGPAVQAGRTTEAGAELGGFVSRDPAMLDALRTVHNVAETDATVLVRGESGTGKELVARAIHTLSHRRQGPFVAVNCASLSPTLLESELFGHVRGAFTGAVSDRAGIFAQANGGTLFLDEVAELPLEVQARLLRVLQERAFAPVGGTKLQSVDVRVVAATHKALREEARAGRFREDLMFRLRVVPIFLPPLRERRQDVDLLLQHFIAHGNTRGPRHVRSIAPDAMQRLLDYPWPGHVRELQTVVEYAFAVARGPEITLAELPPEFRESAPAAVAPAPAWDEATAVRDALRRSNGDIGAAAALLGVSRPTFWRWRKRAGL